MSEELRISELKEIVYKANLALPEIGLVKLTWGNVSAIDRESGLVVIKPSGVEYTDMQAEDMVVVNLEGQVVEGNLKPSSDLSTHLVLYKKYEGIGSVVHTHSEWATSWAQAGLPIPCYGTTHADHFYGEIPCTRQLTDDEIGGEYEMNTGHVIIETLDQRNIKPMEVPGIIIFKTWPFRMGGNSLLMQSAMR